MGTDKNFFKDNRGTSFVLVIACSAFLMMLCFVLLHMAAVNNELKTAEHRNKRSFYLAEAALEEIRTGIEAYVALACSEAYVNVMENYLNSTDEEKQKLMAGQFIEEMESNLAAMPGSGLYSLDLIRSFLTNTPAVLVTMQGENILEKDDINQDNPQYMILRNISISYMDAEQLRTSLITDIVISTPDYKSMQAAGYNPAFAQFGIIADNGILLNTAVDVAVNGCIYSGEGGIFLDNSSSMHITNAPKLITRGDIRVRERSRLKVDADSSVWAGNIMTLKGSDTSDSTTIDISGSCHVADDVTLNASASSIKLAGEYYGFSFNTYKDPVFDSLSDMDAAGSGGAAGAEAEINASGSSSIIINGRDCTLDLSGLDTLFIAGRAYLDPGPGGSVTKDIYTGESLSIKDGQYIYLVPAGYLWCGINPVPEDIYTDFHSNPQSEPEVDFEKAVEQEFPIRLQDYADGASRLFYHLPGGQGYVYYYLKFKSRSHANEYLMKYYELYKNGEGTDIYDIDRQIEDNVDSILINETLRSMMSSGNIYTYNSSDLSSLLPGNIDLNPYISGNSDSLNALIRISNRLSMQYKSLMYHLEPFNGKAAYDENSLFNSIIHTQNLMSDITGYEVKTVGDYIVYIVNNAVGTPYEYEFEIPYDSSLPGMGRKGIVIATGTVRLSGSFEGLIIAGGDVRLESMASVSASVDSVRKILSANDPDINRYFRSYAEGTLLPGDEDGNDHMDISSLITFTNWRRGNSKFLGLK